MLKIISTGNSYLHDEKKNYLGRKSKYTRYLSAYTDLTSLTLGVTPEVISMEVPGEGHKY